MRHIFHRGLTALSLAALILVAACKSGPPETAHQDNVKPSAISTSEIAALLENANQSPPDVQLTQMLEAAEKLVLAEELSWAQNVMDHLPQVYMMYPEYDRNILLARSQLVHSAIDRLQGNYEAALAHLDATALVEGQRLPEEFAFKWYNDKANLLLELEDYNSAIATRTELSDEFILSEEHLQENNAAIWQALMALPIKQIELQSLVAENQTLKGWYTLAGLNKNHQLNLSKHVSMVEDWMHHWPDHPAGLDLPADLMLLKTLLENQPRKIAFVLPMSGQLQAASSRIIDGFMAGFYKSQAQGLFVPELKFYDTQGKDINTIYDTAINDGADLVLGPLSKNNISELALRPELPVPTLAMNQIKLPLGFVVNLFQFGLGVESDAQQNAERIYKDGHRNIIALTINSLWGDRSLNSFTQTLEALAESHIYEQRFLGRNDYAATVKRALHIDQSEARAKDVRYWVGKIEFEPRRRQDIDAIFLSGDAKDARQLKPSLAFHFAGDLPVYATSAIFDGTDNKASDKDLNGIQFTSMPWYFNDDPQTDKFTLTQSQDYTPKLATFYALGVDSYYLYPRLQQLQQVQGAQFYGQTGHLSMDAQGQIQRKQIWATFVNGRPTLSKAY